MFDLNILSSTRKSLILHCIQFHQSKKYQFQYIVKENKNFSNVVLHKKWYKLMEISYYSSTSVAYSTCWMFDLNIPSLLKVIWSIGKGSEIFQTIPICLISTKKNIMYASLHESYSPEMCLVF